MLNNAWECNTEKWLASFVRTSLFTYWAYLNVTESDRQYTIAEAAVKILNHFIACGQACDERRIKTEVFPDLSLDQTSMKLLRTI
jgi:hypothetical protein